MIPDAVKLKLAPLLLRIGLGVIFIYHGWFKISQGMGLEWHAPPAPAEALPAYQQAAVAWGEFLGGIALLIGFLPRLAAAGLIVIMSGAIATVHGARGFNIQEGGYEYNFALIVMCLAVIVLGGGPLAAGARLWRKKKPA